MHLTFTTHGLNEEFWHKGEIASPGFHSKKAYNIKTVWC
jgi:hypothetical protein